MSREVWSYKDHGPEHRSSEFVERFVDLPFDIAAKFAELTREARSVLRDEDAAFMGTWDDALHDALSEPGSLEAHIMNTHELIRRTQASITADSSVPSEMKPVMVHGLDAGWFQATLKDPRMTGHLPRREIVEVRQDFIGRRHIRAVSTRARCSLPTGDG